MTIHKEGRTLLFVSLLVLVSIIWVADYYLHPQADSLRNIIIAVASIFYLLFLQFFRSPVFSISKNENNVLAPADGKVVVIEETDEPEFLKRKCKQISIFMSPVNVHVNRMPVAGTISYSKYHPGK